MTLGLGLANIKPQKQNGDFGICVTSQKRFNNNNDDNNNDDNNIDDNNNNDDYKVEEDEFF